MLNAKNNAETILSASINSSATSLTVADASVLPVVPFVITIDNEIMIVTNVVGNVLTVTRGAESTTPAGHLAGVSVEHRWTAGMHKEVVDGLTAHLAEMATQSTLGHIKLPEALIDGILQNGWASYMSYGIKYRKNDLGIVTVILSAISGTITPLTIIATLPVGYRPNNQIIFPLFAPASGNGKDFNVTIRGSDGLIRICTDTVLTAGVAYTGEISYYAGS